jgi:hypothetical protein
MVGIINISSQVVNTIIKNFSKYQYNFLFLFFARPLKNYFVLNISHRYGIKVHLSWCILCNFAKVFVNSLGPS